MNFTGVAHPTRPMHSGRLEERKGFMQAFVAGITFSENIPRVKTGLSFQVHLPTPPALIGNRS